MTTGKSWPVHDGTMVEQKFHKRLLYARLLRMNAGLSEPPLVNSNPKSLKMTCAAFLPGAIETPGPG